MIKRAHSFLPYERWFAGYAVERQRTHPNAFNLRMETNYGSEGIQLYWAAIADLILGWAISVIGVVLILVSIAVPALWPVSLGVPGLGVAVATICPIRLAQGSWAGRIYRDGRPYIRGPKSRYG
jgi:hypothetical protein